MAGGIEINTLIPVPALKRGIAKRGSVQGVQTLSDVASQSTKSAKPIWNAALENAFETSAQIAIA